MFTLGTHFSFYDLEEKRIATKVDEKRKYFMRRKEKENIQMHGRVLQERKTVPIVWSARGHDQMVVGFTNTYAVSAYYHHSCDFESCSWRGVLDVTLCHKICQWHGRRFFPGYSNYY
jgi:hypothetical protein